MTDEKRNHILGIHHSGPIASAALVQNGSLIAASPEERFTRIKHDKSFPHQAIAFCLKHAGITMGDVDCIALGWNPGENAALKYRSGFSDWMRYPGEWLASVPNHILPLISLTVGESQTQFNFTNDSQIKFDFLDHHLCHARLGLASSGWSDCAVLVVDGWSEQKVTSGYRVTNRRLEKLFEFHFPHSIGCFYAAITDFLGFKPFMDEWKVMGMAAYGRADKFSDLSKTIQLKKDMAYELDLSYFDFFNFDRSRFFSNKLLRLLGAERKPDEKLSQRHFDIAAAGQLVFSQVMNHLIEHISRLSGSRKVILCGGTAMNCLYNGRAVEGTNVEKCSISFAPDDSGNAIGAALEVAQRQGQYIDLSRQLPFWGKGFTNEDYGRVLENYQLRSTIVPDKALEAARLLASGKIIGWFQGRAEFGQRALGNRSIFASPVSETMKDKVNAAIKFREHFRPFAPMIPIEETKQFFDTLDPDPVFYMEKAFQFKPDIKRRCPSVVHADGTGRLQCLAKETAPELYQLLLEFKKLTGVPIVLNTSFNLNGEPIVNTPDDALRCFVTSGMDALFLGDHLLLKKSL